MRPLFAWLLLVCITLQWTVGSLYLKTGYAVEVNRSLSTVETLIGKTVQRELGLEVQVRLLEAVEINRRAMGYNGFFAFSQQVDGETVYYTLEKDSATVVNYTYRLDHLPNPDAPAPGNQGWQRLFPQFRSRIEGPTVAQDPSRVRPAGNFAYTAWRSRAAPAPPAPPPEYRG